MNLDSLLIRGLCVSVLLVALALTQVDLRKQTVKPAGSGAETEVIASQSLEPQGRPLPTR